MGCKAMLNFFVSSVGRGSFLKIFVQRALILGTVAFILAAEGSVPGTVAFGILDAQSRIELDTGAGRAGVLFMRVPGWWGFWS